jgi:hypothetical protein
MSAVRGRSFVVVVSAALCVLVGTLVGAPVAAQAHPFGSPLTATVTSNAAHDEVRVQWMPGASDDFIYLAVGLGLDDRDRSLEKGALLYVKRDADRLAASPVFRDYLLEHVAVRSGGRPCVGRVVSTERIVADGVGLAFDCAAGSSQVDLAISMMTDLHPAYRTLATGPGGERFVYDVDHGEHRWDLAATAGVSDAARSAVVQLSLVLAVLAVGAATALLVVRRRRASRPRPQSGSQNPEVTA